MSAPRKLAAILAADVAGYSRLTGLDEEGTLKRLRKLRRELINPAVALHRGRIVKTTGDGILIEFPSVVDAVRCAVDVQRGMDGRNVDVPAEQRIEFRVGINLGDVVVEGEDLLGDGVNIAARLEGIADPSPPEPAGSSSSHPFTEKRGTVHTIALTHDLLGREPINSEALANVRFGAHSGLKSDIAQGPKSANNGLMHRSKMYLYSITSSASNRNSRGIVSPSSLAPVIEMQRKRGRTGHSG